jgi:hypothetical protein
MAEICSEITLVVDFRGPNHTVLYVIQLFMWFSARPKVAGRSAR